ncbi:MAG: nitroreductase family protein [Thermodesulfobacteriota bacterium]|nr:nitroreductase family protein [Thermodesulfobacteriota bacterium]
MELLEAIKKRHSYRGPMSDQTIPREDLSTIVNAGIMAPSGKNAQTTEFIIIDDPDIIAELNALHPANLAMQQAPAMIACVIDIKPEKIYEGYDFQLEDCAAAVENMLLTITALGYASVWIDGWLRLNQRAEIIGQKLNLPPNKKIQIILPIGVPLEVWPQKQRKDFATRAWFNSYNPFKEN